MLFLCRHHLFYFHFRFSQKKKNYICIDGRRYDLYENRDTFCSGVTLYDALPDAVACEVECLNASESSLKELLTFVGFVAEVSQNV